MTVLTLDHADIIIDAALARGAAIGCAPLTVAVLDAGGHLVALKRQDDSGILRPEIAFGKAWGALGMGLPSRLIGDKNPTFLAAIAVASGGRLVPVPGGVLIRDPISARIIGAVGISGDASDKDEAAATAGIAAAGLTADAGVSSADE